MFWQEVGGIHVDSLKKYFRSDLKIEDVALYILQLLSQDESEVSAMKLQKICFYVQGWYIAKKGRPLFNHDFQAWRYGPVSPTLYKYHAKKATISLNTTDIPGNIQNISDADKKFIKVIVSLYAEYTGLQLSELSHKQDPWIDARRGIPENSPSTNEITLDSMQDYFSKFLKSK